MRHKHRRVCGKGVGLIFLSVIGKASFGTEGAQFQRAGIPTVICGPGSIEQAHKPNEFVTMDQVVQCEAFMRRLADRICERR